MAKSKISPGKYQEILKTIDLQNVYLVETKAKLNENNISPNLEIKVRDTKSFETKDNSFIISYTYRLAGINAEQDNTCLEIVAKFKIKYFTENATNINKEFFDVFAKFSVDFMLWPYFREFVQNLTSKMDLPSLTLPMIKALKK